MCMHVCISIACQSLFTVVSRASAHCRVSAHVPHFKASMYIAVSIQIYGNYVPVSAHAGQNRDVCLSTHGRLPETLRKNIIY